MSSLLKPVMTLTLRAEVLQTLPLPSAATYLTGIHGSVETRVLL
eukprot:CAMPEP_0183462442 /NCGR_PEP_ID=MMETSP0370-20130417/141683_1 /TAXON_ID=268820 /ORGANISM="Peridinium aciculiferum, Strain PAER-2" /LENGTH=43 /DNA_ID= /DNA_START= /DNA_END= /DNA_ORIENTATION=